MKNIQSAEILCTGTELLLGDIVNTNGAFMAQRLAELGIPTYRQDVIGDNPGRLRELIGEAFGRVDTLILCGGLGPTCDDLTKETVAEYFGVPMYLDAPSLEKIKRFFRITGRAMPENNIKQAMIPEGSVIFTNDNGTAPGMAVECGDKTAILLPGPPNELIPMWRDRVDPYLRGRSSGAIVSHNLFIMKMGESAVGTVLEDMIKNRANPSVATYAGNSEVRLRISARAATEAEAEALCQATIAEVQATEVGPCIFGIDVGSSENALLLQLRKRGMTLALAESCTGGLMAKRITDIPGCSDVFLGSCVTYANSAKEAVLGVKHDTLETYGAVSEQTAREMAEGVRAKLGASMGLSVTGVAGPDGGTAEKPVGTVFIAVATEKGTEVRRLSLSSTRSRDFIRGASASKLFGLALDILAEQA